MPHYRDGTKAEPGDVVKGVGYNVPHEVVGKVLKVTEAESCNLTLACISKESRVFVHEGKDPEYAQRQVEVTIEYGECSSFEKIA